MELKETIVFAIYDKLDNNPVYKSAFEILFNGQTIWCEIDYHIYFVHGYPDVRLKIKSLEVENGCEIDPQPIEIRVCEMLNKQLA
jgi:hypothetical protein